MDNAIEFASALFGAWHAGKVVYLPGDNLPETCARLRAEVNGFLGEFTVECSPILSAPHRRDDDTDHFDRLESDFVGLVLYTSGTTGAPQAIAKKLVQLAREVATLESEFGALLGTGEIVGTVSHQHIYGLLFRILWPLASGRALHAQSYFYFEDLAAALAKRNCVLVSSPAHLQRLPNNFDWTEPRKRVRAVFSSGGPLIFEATAETNRLLGSTPIEVYGSSETGGIAWRQGQDLWQPFNGVELSQDSDGALLIASPYLPAGHIEHTADAARIAADGRFELLGRLDRIVKLEEKRISLPMLEHALMAHAWVAEARLGVVQENRASLGALLVLSERGMHALRNQGRRSLTQALRQHLSQHCETLALPRRWRLLRQLPLNAQGKLPQAEVEALLLAPRPKAPQVLEQVEADGEWSLQLAVPPDLAYFSGHFPRAPVLPGVVQVEWAMSLGQQLMDLPAKFAGMEVLKFQQLVRPGDEIQLHLRFDPVRGKLYFAYRNETATCSSGRILLEAASDA
jgi:3-hydroxymyristoyl/3-hydroxydecanoyl-(acyl carrier protein) dehydratase